MAVLVTGGAGYIGSHTVVELLNVGKEVVIVDDLSNSSEKVVDRIEEITGKRPKFYKVNILDEKEFEKIFEEHPCINVMHVVLLCEHGNQLITQNKGYNHPGNRSDHRIRQILAQTEYTATPPLGRLPNLTCNVTSFFINIGKHVRQV